MKKHDKIFETIISPDNLFSAWRKFTKDKKNRKDILQFDIHPQKVFIRKPHQGVDFLGYVEFPHHRILRTKTKKRILAKIRRGISENSLQSYLGVLSHANSHNLAEEIKNLYLFTKK